MKPYKLHHRVLAVSADNARELAEVCRAWTDTHAPKCLIQSVSVAYGEGRLHVVALYHELEPVGEGEVES